MNGENRIEKLNAIGIGFLALDIIKYEEKEIILLGGTCANVLSILTYMFEWNADIIKRRYNDEWNNFIDSMLYSIGVGIMTFGFVDLPTPRVVQTISGGIHHHYTTCPYCKSNLVKIDFPSKRDVSSAIDKKEYDLLFFDRISASTKYLINLFVQNNKWIFYEPNSMRNYNTLLNNIATCDIVKFSDSRISKFYYKKLLDDLNCMPHRTKIVLITHAERGFSYSVAKEGRLSTAKTISIKPFTNIVDSSGAGDWLTAGFIHKFIQYYHVPPDDIADELIIDSLLFGHKLAEIGCNYVGALGRVFSDKKLKYSCPADLCGFCKSEAHQ